MKKAVLVIIVCAAFNLTSLAAPSLYQFYFRGTCSTTDNSGRIVSSPINNQSLIQDFATGRGVTNTAWLGLAYHVGGSDLGDTIDVINRNDGSTVATLFGLYFGEDFGRMSLLSSSHRQMKRIEYVYTDQNSHSIGSALITDYFYFDKQGNTNNLYVLGQMQYLLLGDAVHTNVLICTANFATVRPWTFNSQH